MPTDIECLWLLWTLAEKTCLVQTMSSVEVVGSTCHVMLFEVDRATSPLQ